MSLSRSSLLNWADFCTGTKFSVSEILLVGLLKILVLVLTHACEKSANQIQADRDEGNQI